MLRQERRSRLDLLHLTIHFDDGSDGVAIRLGAGQGASNRVTINRAVVLELAELRTDKISDDQVHTAVAVEIDDCEGTAVLGEIESAHAGAVDIATVAVRVEPVRLRGATGVVFV